MITAIVMQLAPMGEHPDPADPVEKERAEQEQQHEEAEGQEQRDEEDAAPIVAPSGRVRMNATQNRPTRDTLVQ